VGNVNSMVFFCGVRISSLFCLFVFLFFWFFGGGVFFGFVVLFLFADLFWFVWGL